MALEIIDKHFMNDEVLYPQNVYATSKKKSTPISEIFYHHRIKNC